MSRSYDDLLELFWTSHDPTRSAWKTQYASLILAHDDGQLAAARESAERLVGTVGRSVTTRIERLERFWIAEDYHQKYYLKNDRLLYNEMRAVFPAEKDLVDSTAAARVNGYLYGSASCMQLERELPELGLSDRASGHLRMHCHG